MLNKQTIENQTVQLLLAEHITDSASPSSLISLNVVSQDLTVHTI